MIARIDATIELMESLWWIVFLPILDLILLSRMPKLLGGQAVIIWLVCSAVLGVLAIRTGGFRLGRSRAREEPELLDRALILIAGLLLVFPGPASDVLGIIILFPRIRRKIIERLLGTILGRWIGALNGGRPARRGSARSGRTREKYPGAEDAREVEFQESSPPTSELKNNKR
jgi:UPF0716 protein FxsA